MALIITDAVGFFNSAHVQSLPAGQPDGKIQVIKEVIQLKLLHLADLHIGKNENGFSMLDDQQFILEKIIETARKKKVDAILLAGDIYDRKDPTEDAVNLFDRFINTVHRSGMKLLAISGNHDSDDRLNFGSRIFREQNIFICGKYEGTLAKETFNDEFGPVNFYLLPFVKASHVSHYLDRKFDDYEQAVQAVIASADINYDERNVILAHQFVSSDSRFFASQFSGSESNGAENVGNVEIISKRVFENFDYTALGHLHSPQQVGQPNIRYSGSPLKYSLNEIDSVKSLPLITLREKGNLEIELLELQPKRNMRHIKGLIDDLLRKENIIDPDDYLRVTLLDDHIIPNAMDRVRFFYPNAMKLDYRFQEDRSTDISAAAATRDRSFAEMAEEFYRLSTGRDISERESELLMEAAREAGIIE